MKGIFSWVSPAIAVSMIRIMVMVVVVVTVAVVSVKRLRGSLCFAFPRLWLTFRHRASPEAMAIEAAIPAVKTSQAISMTIVWAKAKSIVRIGRPLFSGFHDWLRILSRPFPEMSTVETVPI
jgi:hypothetical protein